QAERVPDVAAAVVDGERQQGLRRVAQAPQEGGRGGGEQVRDARAGGVGGRPPGGGLARRYAGGTAGHTERRGEAVPELGVVGALRCPRAQADREAGGRRVPRDVAPPELLGDGEACGRAVRRLLLAGAPGW